MPKIFSKQSQMNLIEYGSQQTGFENIPSIKTCLITVIGSLTHTKNKKSANDTYNGYYQI